MRQIVGRKALIPNIPPECLFGDTNNKEIPIYTMKWVVKGSMSYLITGDQGSGKTTTFKSFIRFYPPSACLRINELQPEMHLRFAYPERNIISFSETPYIPTQEGLNFQKKTSGAYNLIGEIASAEAAAWFIQTCKVASKAGAGTHHGKTVRDTITAIRDNVIQVYHYTDAKAVEEMVADAIDFDMHMDRVAGFRYCERISEIQSVKQQEYPFPDLGALKPNQVPDGQGKTGLDMAALLNDQEFKKRITDRKTFTYKNVCEYDKEAKRYYAPAMFSDVYIKQIKKNLTNKEIEEFERDMAIIDAVNSSIPRYV